MDEIVRVFADLPRRMSLVALFCVLALLGGEAAAAEPKVTVTVGQNDEAFIVDATLDVQVSLDTAWQVMTDFDHMTSILSSLTSSKVTARDGNTWIVRQEGAVRYGLLAFSFASEREIRLEPMKRMLAKNLSGTLKRMESESRLGTLNHGVQLKYHAEIVPDSLLVRLFGASFVKHGVEEQFLAMAEEMGRRHADANAADKGSALPDRGTQGKSGAAGI